MSVTIFRGRFYFSALLLITGVSANFHHISELYEMELSKPVKMAYTLTHECLNPEPIEKTKVYLATRIFGEPTRNAMSFYVNNGYPRW